ncbi:MAG: GDYXXLXY domain-containing protein [Alphaproteobacteria bacterium]|nr:GDYXXLXY domain-containing protein [Alphaproteobacteria bacterium]
MNKKFLILALSFPFIALIVWTISLYIQQSTGTEIKVAIMGYDPRDLLSGHYIRYTIDWKKTDCSQFPNGICPKEEFCKQSRFGNQCRFYIPERHAEKLDRLFRRRNNTTMIFEVIYSYQAGREPLAKKLLINGKDWRESLKKK